VIQDYTLLSPADTQEARSDFHKFSLPLFGLGLLLALIGFLAGWWLGPYAIRFWQVFVPTGEKSAWYFTRATATVAYLLMTGATVWGLLLSTKLVKAHVPAPLALALHSALSWLGVILAIIHALLLLFDNYYSYSLRDLLIPFTGPYRPGWVGLGVLSLYGVALTAGSFEVRQWLGHRLWRRLHYISFPLFGLVTLHGLMSGTDSSQPGAWLIYALAASLVLFLTLYRLLTFLAPAAKVRGA
jgi:methionine sulfoxide reductase heme-binding subunit